MKASAEQTAHKITGKEIKHYQVRLYPNGKFKVVETTDFHPSNMDSVFSSFNGTTKESYDFIVADENGILKAKKKIAKHLIKDVKKNRDFFQKRLVSLMKILHKL